MNRDRNRRLIPMVDVLAEFFEVCIHLILFVRTIYPPELFEDAQKYSCPIKIPRHPGLQSYVASIVAAVKQELYKDTIERIAVVILSSPSSSKTTSQIVLERFVFDLSSLGATNIVVHQEQQQHLRSPPPPQPQPSAIAKGKQRAHGPDMGDDDGNESLWVHSHGYGDSDGRNADMYTVTNSMSGKQNQMIVGHQAIEASEDAATMLRAMLLRISVCSSSLPSLPAGCSFSVVIELRNESTNLDGSSDFPWSPISPSVSQDEDKISRNNIGNNNNNNNISSPPNISFPSTTSSYLSPLSAAGRNQPALAGVAKPSPGAPRPKKIIPVKTINLNSTQLELFVESLHS